MAKANDAEVPAESVTAAGIVGPEVETVVPAPAFDPEALKQLVSHEVAQALIGALPAVLPELLRGLIPNVGALPSAVVPMSIMPTTPDHPKYLKHYRMDGVISGKYQYVDVSKLDGDELQVDFFRDHNNQMISSVPGVVKGKWIHFVNEHFYAQDPGEVAFIEWKARTDPSFRVYEDRGAGAIPCTVVNCKHSFTDNETLTAHLRATHGVG